MMKSELSYLLQSGQKVKPSKSPALGRFTGKWINELDSVMTLQENAGSLTGEYVSEKSAGGGTVTGKLVGFADDDIFSIVVKWNEYSSATAWVGQIENVGGKETLKTLWHLVMNVEDEAEPEKAWSSILTGADRFTKLSS